MWLKMYPFIAYFIIFCNQYKLVSVMVGENVRYAFQGEFPNVVSIKYMNFTNRNPEKDHVCTGVLVSNRDILTVSHCNENFIGAISEIMIGACDIRQCQRYYAAWWMNYNQWCDSRRIPRQSDSNDITMIRLIQSVPSHIQFARLSSMSSTDLRGETVTIAGFGMTTREEVSRFMQTVNLQIISNRDCRRRIERLRGSKYKIENKYMCAVAEPFALMSAGNSGSPVFHDNLLVAIHKGTCPNLENLYHPEKVNLLMSVDYYRQYILEIINI